jgi:hypothetical protein
MTFDDWWESRRINDRLAYHDRATYTEEGWNAGSRAERAAIAEQIQAAGCVCGALQAAHDDCPEVHEFHGVDLPHGGWDIHDPRCPVALAAAIEARGEGR